MTFRTSLPCALVISLAAPALAEDWPAGTLTLTAGQIETLLSGNTAVGTWSGEGYRQYYDPSGSTVYLSRSAPPDHGKWRVNAETDRYESWWERGGWAAYTIVVTNEGYAWINREALEPFVVLPGRALHP